MGKNVERFGNVSEKYLEMQNIAKERGGRVAKFTSKDGSGQFSVVDKKGNVVQDAPSLFWAGKGKEIRFEYHLPDGKQYISGEQDDQKFSVIHYGDGRVAIDENKDGIVNDGETHLDVSY